MPSPPSDLHIRDYGRADLPESAVAGLVALRNAQRVELRPGDLPAPLTTQEAEVRAPDTAGWRSHWSIAWRGDEPVGYAETDVDTLNNPDISWLYVYVDPAQRRQGIGGALTAHALGEVQRACDPAPTKTGFDVAITSDVGRDLQARIEQEWGLSVGIVGRKARLDLADIDRPRIEAAHERRIAGLGERYRLLFFANTDIPDPSTGFQVKDFCATYEMIMNLMPLEDLQLEHESFPPERWRSMVARMQATGRSLWHLVCCEPDGHVVGLTAVAFAEADHRMVEQWDTGVLAEAQGNGIGSALKLDMLLRILDGLPEARFVDTDNAHSNVPMIAINTALGFHEHRLNHVYQLPIAQLCAHLGVEAP